MPTATTVPVKMAQRRDTAANWTSANPTLLAGEIGIESDTLKWKVGTGSTSWTSLGYTPWSQVSAYPLVNADIASAAAIAYSKLATLTSGNIVLGSSANVATSTAVTGDVTISNTGVTAIASGVIVNADINASAAIVDTKLATIATAGKVSNSATTAASANTASAIVARDASGNFTAGTITAALTGTASGNLVSGGALGTPSSGTLTSCTGLPISTGVSGLGTGAATFLATPSSANFAALLTDETGSGSNVFATSPTLVTPVIGAATGTSLSITGAAGLLTRAAATQDGVELIGRAGGTTSLKATITPTTLTASRTFTLPDATGTLVTTGDTGTVTSTMLLNGTILDADINASAAIVDTKLATIATAGKVSNSATTAASANTASAIVARDASGNFTAGTITAALTGTASGNLVSGGALGTPTSGTLTNCTGLPIGGLTASTSTALGVGSIELGDASDTTLSRSAAGVLAVEGVVIPSISSTSTLTNKTLTDPAIVGTILEDIFTITDAAAFEVDPGNGSIQLITLGASRTPKCTNFVAGESVTLMINDGTAYTITWTDATWGTGGVIWKGGTAPTLATTGYSVIQFWKVSTQVYGASVGNVA